MLLPPVATWPVLLGGLWAVELWVAPGIRAQNRPDDAESGDPAPVRVVAYNLRNWLHLERRVDGEIVAEAPKPEAEKAVAVRMLAALKPDVVGICEIGTEEDLADLQARLRAAGIDLPEAHWHRGADEVRRLGLLTRFPITRREPPGDHRYVLDGRTLRFQRGILDVTLQITSDYELRLVGTHLKSRREVEEGDQAAIRRHEAVLLRQHVESILSARPRANLLVYGDFNDTKNEQTIKIVQGRFGDAHHLRDLWLEDADGHRFTYYWNVADTYDRIDFAFVSQGLWPEIDTRQSFIAKDTDWLKASDHRPLVIAVHPREAGGKARR
ncbi:MAG: endonuclease/exonuclease/phosphatase family protein [Verrucomicrobiales bacterium]